ncbi:hypothetical protein B9Z55_023435 [Caenorhabditis nigoni]|nr:hypothetical protein B9Z55_023435 [Caenorhabditis nigoni]
MNHSITKILGEDMDTHNKEISQNEPKLGVPSTTDGNNTVTPSHPTANLQMALMTQIKTDLIGLTIKEVLFNEKEEKEITSRESVQEILNRFQVLADRDASNRKERSQSTRTTMQDAVAGEYQTLGEMLDVFPRPLISEEEEEEITSRKSIQEILNRFQKLADRGAAER